MPSQAFVLDISTHVGIVMSKWAYNANTEIGINFVDGCGKHVTKIASPATTYEPAISIDSSGRLIVSSQNGRYVDVKVLLL